MTYNIASQIMTSFDYPPVPSREFDWSAIWDCHAGEDDVPRGFGKTEESAVIDLIQNSLDHPDGCDEAIDAAIELWNIQRITSVTEAEADKIEAWLKQLLDGVQNINSQALIVAAQAYRASQRPAKNNRAA